MSPHFLVDRFLSAPAHYDALAHAVSALTKVLISHPHHVPYLIALARTTGFEPKARGVCAR